MEFFVCLVGLMGFFTENIFLRENVEESVFSLARLRSRAMCLKQEREEGEFSAVAFILSQ